VTSADKLTTSGRRQRGRDVAQGTWALTRKAAQRVHTSDYNDKETRRRRIASSGMLRRVALVRTDVSEEPSASFIRVTRIGELGTTRAVTINRRTLPASGASDS
jgi:hypothetical protein